MSDLTALISRVRLALDDPDSKRFPDGLLTTAIRQALEQIDQRLPRSIISDVTSAVSGREQPLTGLTGCLFLVKLVYPAASDGKRELEPETQFSYVMRDGIPTVHFYGDAIPQAGEVLLVHYAARNTIEGLDAAVSSTLPEVCEPALVNGAAGSACALRASSLVEAYGARPADFAHLMDASRHWMDLFSRALDGLKVLQDFGFPPGFALDCWDRVR
jgi:hypothetical protein